MKVIDAETGEEFNLDEQDESFREERAAFHNNKCQHPDTEIRECKIADGGVQRRHQCLTCGELIGQAVGKALAPTNIRPKDEGLRQAYENARDKAYAELIQRHVQKQKAENSHWLAQHGEYLKTPEWRGKRAKVLERAKGVCEGCGVQPATDVHHLTYRNYKAEFLFELVAVCRDCHDRLHERDELPKDSIWREGYPCAGCRWQAEQDFRWWCSKFDLRAADALADDGPCGPNHSELEPLK